MSRTRRPSGILRIVLIAAAMALPAVALPACGATSVPKQEGPKQEAPSKGAPAIVYSADLGASLYNRIDEIARQQSGPFEMQTTDQQATSALLYTAGQFADNPVRQAAIWFTEGQFHVYAQLADLTPMILNVRATGRIRVADGWPSLSLEQASVGALSLPGFVRSWLARVATETIRDTGIHHRFHSVGITDGRLTVTGEVLP